MNKEELLKEIMKLPKIETDNPICTMNGINVDELMSAIDRLNKIPDYNDLLKENKQLKDNWNKLKEWASNFYNSEEVGWAGCGMRYTLEKMQELEKGSGSDE